MRIWFSCGLITAATVLAIATPVEGFSLSGFFDDFSIGALFGFESATQPESFTAPPADAMDFGTEGSLTEEEIVVLLHLQFPQSYDAVVNRLGFPAKRDELADYYKLGETQQWAAVWYEDGQATNYTFSE